MSVPPAAPADLPDSEPGPGQCPGAELSCLGSVPVRSCPGWNGRVLGGSFGTIRVWDISTGLMEADLITGNTITFSSLVVNRRKDMLISASKDGFIRSWALGTWSALRTVLINYEVPNLVMSGGISERTNQLLCLALSGGMIISGSACEEQGLLHVWNPDTFVCENTVIMQPGPSPDSPGWITCIMPVEGEVWCGVGTNVMVWGRDREVYSGCTTVTRSQLDTLGMEAHGDNMGTDGLARHGPRVTTADLVSFLQTPVSDAAQPAAAPTAAGACQLIPHGPPHNDAERATDVLAEGAAAADQGADCM